MGKLKENLSFFWKYRRFFLHYRRSLNSFIDLYNAKKPRAALRYFKSTEELKKTLFSFSNAEQHAIGIVRIQGNHHEAVSIYKNPSSKDRISCLVFDSCAYGEGCSRFDSAFIEGARDAWGKIVKKTADGSVLITALGTQNDWTSCGDFAFSAAKKMCNFRNDLVGIHRAHLASNNSLIRGIRRDCSLGNGHEAHDVCESLPQAPHISVTNNARYLKSKKPELLTNLLLHDQSREHLSRAVQAYSLQDEAGKASLLERFDRISPPGSSILQKRDALLQRILERKAGLGR